MEILFQCLLLAAGFVLLVKGANWFVDGASGIADRFGVPQLVIGLTIVAMGTSMPEAAVSIAAALKGSAEITIGNVVGSNIFNIFIILGITASIIAVKVAKSTIKIEIPYMLLITLLLLGLGYTGNVVSFVEGIVLWAAFIIYLVYLFRMAKQDQEEVKEQDKQKSLVKMVLSAIIGLAVVILGSDIAVDAATNIATFIGISERIIGLTIVAAGTSLPELVTSISAALKGKADIAIGNIVGSNIFNILFVVGTAALITPVVFEPNFIIDMLIAVAAGVILWLCVFKKSELRRTGGIIMLVCYAAYFVYLLV